MWIMANGVRPRGAHFRGAGVWGVLSGHGSLSCRRGPAEGMVVMRRFLVSALLGVIGLALVGPGEAKAAFITFSGIDSNPADNSTVRIPHPNADAARTQFLSNLTGVGTETFE